MIPTLEQISIDPDILRIFLISQGLSGELKDQVILDLNVNDEKSFIWSKKTRLSLNRIGGGNYSYKFNNENLFYSIALPNFTKSQIGQLNSVLTFIDTLFNNGTPIQKNGSFFVSVMSPVVTVKTDLFTLFRRNQNYFSFSNKHLSINLKDLEFETIYSAILNNLNILIENYLKRKLHIIDTSVFKLIIDESIPVFINRLFKESTVQPVSSLTFLECFDPVTFNIIKGDYENFNEFQENDDSYVLNVNNDFYYSISIYIKNIKILKNLLIKSMSLEDINALIQSISMTVFYHNIMEPHDQISYFKFTRSNIFGMSKSDISDVNYIYEIVVGDYSFNLGKNIFMEPINSNDSRFEKIIGLTTHELYENQFKFINESICKLLSRDPENVCVRDLKVIEMMLL